jgi:glycosyltransferase involved in cell wall biosynthesis
MHGSSTQKTIKILYLHPVGLLGGSTKSLFELFKQLHPRGVGGLVITPAGQSSDAFRDLGMNVITGKRLSQFDNTRHGYYRGLRWLILLRELFLLPSSIRQLWRARKEQFDIIHLNEITLLPIGILAKYLFKKPLIVHVRSLQRGLGIGWRTWLINRLLARYSDAVIAIDLTVASTLPTSLPIHVIHNGIDMSTPVRFSSAHTRPPERPVRVGFLGMLIPLKGIRELLKAILILKQRGLQIECLVAGENAHKFTGISAWTLRKLGFAWDMRAELEEFIAQNELEQQVRLLGFVHDVHAIYPQLDILCFPSFLDAAGRPVFEAALYGIPSVLAISNPLPDALLHEVTGLAISTSDPVVIANALQRLAENRTYREQLGEQAREWACKEFSIQKSADLTYSIYLRLISTAT